MSLAAKSATPVARKRCLKCGKAGYYRPRAQRCRYVEQLFKGRYLCYGQLQTVVKKEEQSRA